MAARSKDANRKAMNGLRHELRAFLVEAARMIAWWVHRGTIRATANSPGTPVDTGEARSGGRISLNSPSLYQPPAEAPAYPVPGYDHVRSATRGIKPGDRIFWNNNVPYVGVLEGGRRYSDKLGRMVGSEQAEEGFLNKAVERDVPAELARWRFRRRAA